MKNRIQELRKARGMSQRELAKEIGVSFQSISFYERGERKPKLETWIKLARFFDVPISYIQGISDIDVPEAFNDFEKFVSKIGIENERGDVAIPRKEAIAFSNEASYKAIELLREAALNISDTSEVDIKKYNKIISSIPNKGVLDDIGLFVTTLYKLLLDAYDGDAKAMRYREKILPILKDYLGISDFEL